LRSLFFRLKPNDGLRESLESRGLSVPIAFFMLGGGYFFSDGRVPSAGDWGCDRPPNSEPDLLNTLPNVFALL
jgi:hypothetical protein